MGTGGLSDAHARNEMGRHACGAGPKAAPAAFRMLRGGMKGHLRFSTKAQVHRRRGWGAGKWEQSKHAPAAGGRPLTAAAAGPIRGKQSKQRERSQGNWSSSQLGASTSNAGGEGGRGQESNRGFLGKASGPGGGLMQPPKNALRSAGAPRGNLQKGRAPGASGRSSGCAARAAEAPRRPPPPKVRQDVELRRPVMGKLLPLAWCAGRQW